MELDAGDRLLDRKEVEQHFGIPKRYLELAVMRGDGPRIVRVGRLVRYRVSDVRLWIEANASAEG
ncbi:helix-turn-helix transcriptional regulator [Roseovarius sp.]|uniref:helix-turn-helix transcriptional regulator n=1 Tax=Roseovarius sp. TaxID=1486281 RepID=UPI003BA8EA91